MTGILRATLLATLVSCALPAAATAQKPSVDSLLRRIDRLERITADLQLRVSELELSRSEPSRVQPVPASVKWRDLQNWRRLRVGMKMGEVRALLGEPDRVDVAIFATWLWNNEIGMPVANARFDRESGKLEGWSEP